MSEKLCEMVRAEYDHDREFCLYPFRYHDGMTQIRSIAYNRVTTINLKFFEPYLQVWAGEGFVLYYPSNRKKYCFYVGDFICELMERNRDIGIWFLYSLFLNALRLLRIATPYKGDDTAYYAAITTAAGAAYFAHRDDATTYRAIHRAAAAAHRAVDPLYRDNDTVTTHIRKAFRCLIKYRKLVMKRDEIE